MDSTDLEEFDGFEINDFELYNDVIDKSFQTDDEKRNELIDNALTMLANNTDESPDGLESVKKRIYRDLYDTIQDPELRKLLKSEAYPDEQSDIEMSKELIPPSIVYEYGNNDMNAYSLNLQTLRVLNERYKKLSDRVHQIERTLKDLTRQ